MGYAAIVVLHLDAVQAFKDYPKEFGEAVLAAVVKAGDSGTPASQPVQGYANYITAQPPVHTNDVALYLFDGGACTCLNGRAVREAHPDYQKSLLHTANSCLADAEALLSPTRRSRRSRKPHTKKA